MNKPLNETQCSHLYNRIADTKVLSKQTVTPFSDANVKLSNTMWVLMAYTLFSKHHSTAWKLTRQALESDRHGWKSSNMGQLLFLSLGFHIKHPQPL